MTRVIDTAAVEALRRRYSRVREQFSPLLRMSRPAANSASCRPAVSTT